MAETTTAEVTPTSLGDATLDSYYQGFLKTLPNQQISYNPIEYERRSIETLSDQVSKYLRNYYDQSINTRKQQTVQYNAAADVDAYSRNMGESTFLSDLKNRQSQSEAADIANLNADYNAALTQAVQEQYNADTTNWLGVQSTNRSNQIEVDEWNAAAKLALEELSYTRAVQAKANAALAAAAAGGGYGGYGGGGYSSVSDSGSPVAKTGSGNRYYYTGSVLQKSTSGDLYKNYYRDTSTGTAVATYSIGKPNTNTSNLKSNGSR